MKIIPNFDTRDLVNCAAVICEYPCIFYFKNIKNPSFAFRTRNKSSGTNEVA